MSQSFAHDDPRRPQDISSAGGSLDEQIADEIADHLAAAASDLVRRGESEDHAAQLALARFGDVARITRQCWWTHKREEVMLRVATLAVLVLLTAGVAVVGFGGWQLQRNLASRTEELSEQLATLSATQKAMLDQQRPPEISGVAYLGDKSHPAKDVEIQVYRFREEPSDGTVKESGVVVRRVRTNESGHFDSGILQSGDYCLLGPLMARQGTASDEELLFGRIQSRPLYLTVGAGRSAVDMDLAALAQIQLEGSEIPGSVKIGDKEVGVTVGLVVYPEEGKWCCESWTGGPVPPSVEPPRDGWPVPLPLPPNTVAGVSLKQGELSKSRWLPPRGYSIDARLYYSYSVSIQPTGLQETPKPKFTEIKLATGDLAILSVSVVGDPLQVRADAAVKDYEMKHEKLLGVAADPVSNVLRTLAKEIELKVDVTMQRSGTSAPTSAEASN